MAESQTAIDLIPRSWRRGTSTRRSRIHIRGSQTAIDNFRARDLVEFDIADFPARQGLSQAR